MDCDIAIVGAGVAGLAASAELVRAGRSICCLEAGERVGGRILTVHDPAVELPIELGAEFIHGRPPATWNLIQTAGLTAYEHSSRAVHAGKGRSLGEEDTGELAEKLIHDSASSHDESLESLLRRSRRSESVKQWAIAYVEGFNAAHKERISTAALRQDARAADRIDGDRSFRILKGYDALSLFMLQSIPGHRSILRLNHRVESVQWKKGSVTLQARSTITRESVTLRCAKAIFTVPLGVLQAAPGSLGAINFDPEPAAVLKAANSLAFGQVFRVTFRFENSFWEEKEKFANAGFIISREKVFPTWWSARPIIAPILTGWSAGPAADPFLRAQDSVVISEALASLSLILGRKVPPPCASYFHNWHADPDFRGAYSYVPVGRLPARRVLSRPIEGTLFFAGEATDTSGRGGTVDGAITTGIRAAGQVLSSD